ncbi:hypothetical protein EV378_4895 [Pseudonocardia endophytica]|uniref:Glycosyltransferase involved in cell wall biosynthesis n=1 Tax=Pseudonocardia endophytica TaxID=401976 RepID=A0A4R1HGT4_PSEEN|nr:hypothetical protein EV378_4895 [Pseudonocardia endophytica]
MSSQTSQAEASVRPGSVMVVVSDYRGHRLLYIRSIIEESHRRNRPIILLGCSGFLKSDEYALHISGLRTDLVAEVSQVDFSTVRKIAKRYGASTVIIPDGDQFLPSATFRRWKQGELRLLVMRAPSFPPSRPVNLVKLLCIWIASFRKNISVFVLTSALRRTVKRFEVRDPIYIEQSNAMVGRAIADEIFGSRVERPYCFGVVGSVTWRKNIDLVLDACVALDFDWMLIFAGKIEPRVRRVITSSVASNPDFAQRIVIIDRLLTDAELDHVIRTIDCIILAHSNDGPSGVMGRASAIGTRVVAAGAPTLEKDCLDWPEGAEFTRLGASSIGDAMNRAMRLSKPQPNIGTLNSQPDFLRKMIG